MIEIEFLEKKKKNTVRKKYTAYYGREALIFWLEIKENEKNK